LDALNPTLWRPRLRESLVIERDAHELLFISTSDRRVKRFTATRTVIELIPLLDGTRTVADLVERLCGNSEAMATEVGSALAVLRQEQLLSRVADPFSGTTSLTPAQVAFYSRQILLFQDLCDSGQLPDQAGLAVQERLLSATVVVCGLGGLGSVVASALAAAGVGVLIVVDDDVVEASNLTRQLTYSMDDVGRNKADALASRLGRINPDVRFRPEKRTIAVAADLADLAAESDLVISCADQPTLHEVAAIVTEACWPGIPHFIAGGYSFHVGLVGILTIPRVTACYHCIIATFEHCHGRDRTVPFMAKSKHHGIVGAQSGIIGNMVAWECIRYLIGLKATLSNRLLEFNYGDMSFDEAAVPRHADCPWCAER
jgi:molybdopterin/thiamine biosynthesis adenylyltransferase